MTATYDTQSWHLDIPGIRSLAQVVPEGGQMPAGQFALVAQAYDTDRYQSVVGTMLEGRLRGIRSRFGEDEVIREERTVSRLSRLVDFAYSSVPFYRDLYGAVGYRRGEIRSLKDFGSLPVISKSDLSSVDFEYRVSALARKPHFLSRTSGTSGNPLNYAYGLPKCFAEMVNYIWMCEQALGKPLDPNRWIMNIHNARWWFSSILGRYRTFALADMPRRSDFESHVVQLKPQVLVTLPSHLKAIMDASDKVRLAGIEAVTTNSEQSSLEERLEAEKVLGIPVRDEYSSTELGTIAFEGKDRFYHLLEDSVYIELLDEVGGIGQVVGTRLTNRIMPTIRYRQGDYATMATSGAADHSGRALREIHGRLNSSFKTRDGRIIASATLMGILDEYLSDKNSGMAAFQLVQKSVEALELRYVAAAESPASTAAAIAAVKANLVRVFGYGLQFAVIEVSDLSNVSGYKRQYLYSEI